MAITVLSKSSPLPVAGGNAEGLFEQYFSCAFSTTDATGTVPSGLRRVLRVGSVVPLEEPADDEHIYFYNTVRGDGSLTLATGDVLSLGRTGLSLTSGLKFSFTIQGYR